MTVDGSRSQRVEWVGSLDVRGFTGKGPALGSTPIIKDLQLAEDMPFQRREWVIQRIGWGVMALIVLAALLGFMGRGPFSSMVAGERDGPLWVEYHRYARFQTPQRLHVHWGPGAADPNGVVRLWVNKEYFVTNTLEQILPEPKRALAGEDHIIFEFETDAPGQMGSAILHVTTNHIGRCNARIGVGDGGSVGLWQWVYP